ncbi:MAG TPA: inositol monophosphatase family protein [Ktedonobacteraceae bacterium]|nr:inositol monophosphatase family protein [Ktedonobacteraceae bacterium]
MLELLEQLFRKVRVYMQSERFDRYLVYSRSTEHTTMQFDREAEDIIVSGLIESGHSFEIITEERPTFSTSNQPSYRIIIDPVDGSTNVARGILTAGVSLAVLSIDKPIVPQNVLWSLVGELYSGTVYQAQRDLGAFCNGRRCQVSKTCHIEQCLTGINFDGRDTEVLRKLLVEQPPVKNVRRSGSSSMDITYVANGAYDAYIDIGDVLTGESFLAPLHIVLQAGGFATDQYGKPLRPISNLTEGFSLVVAGTKELHSELLSRIQS